MMHCEQLYYHGEPISVNVHVTNNSTKTVKRVKISGLSVTNLSVSVANLSVSLCLSHLSVSVTNLSVSLCLGLTCLSVCLSRQNLFC